MDIEMKDTKCGSYLDKINKTLGGNGATMLHKNIPA